MAGVMPSGSQAQALSRSSPGFLWALQPLELDQWVPELSKRPQKSLPSCLATMVG